MGVKGTCPLGLPPPLGERGGHPLKFRCVATQNDFSSFTPQIPYQYIQHTKYIWDNSVNGGGGKLKANIAYQRNQRQEFGNVLIPNEKSLYFDLGTLNYSIQYLFPEKNIFAQSIKTLFEHFSCCK